MFKKVRYLNVIKKFLTTQEFVVDGYRYDFTDIHEGEQGDVMITVNVILPNPGQSWVSTKFSWDISNIRSEEHTSELQSH